MSTLAKEKFLNDVRELKAALMQGEDALFSNAMMTQVISEVRVILPANF
jgi:hypothetical protein